ncbi:hypothetical protein GGI20_002049 [Coemansia sp. BCRC 34301]|nr:hypothetical protein GGI20_002049 [Coemansia sp. BCRC 34301]
MSQPPPPPPPPAVDSAGQQSDTDDDSGIAASVTRLATSNTDSVACVNQLSPRLSLRLSVDASGLFTGSALGLSAFVAPLAPSTIPEETEADTTTVPEKIPLPASDSDNIEEEEEEEDPVRARLRSLRSRRLANNSAAEKPVAETNQRRFRATQSINGRAASSSRLGDRSLAKMGTLQLDRLTKLNTRRNATYMACRIERFPVICDGARPPSPSSAMLARAQERKKLTEPTSDVDDESMSDEEYDEDYASEDHIADDVRPITPDFSEDDVEYPSVPATDNPVAMPGTCGMASDIKRKSIEVAEDSSSSSCVSPAQRSESTGPILVNRDPPPSNPGQPSPSKSAVSDLCIVRVACIEYPSHISDDDMFVDAAESQPESVSNPEDSPDEFVPRRSTRSTSGRRKKVD